MDIIDNLARRLEVEARRRIAWLGCAGLRLAAVPTAAQAGLLCRMLLEPLHPENCLAACTCSRIGGLTALWWVLRVGPWYQKPPVFESRNVVS
ncbi:MAG: hypothetical protein ACKPKO_18415, partial [Candidatus Fonsibacter sp.]